MTLSLSTDYEALSALESRDAAFYRARAKKRGPTWGRIADEVLADYHHARAVAFLAIARDRDALTPKRAHAGAGV